MPRRFSLDNPHPAVSALLIALAVTVILWFVPFAGILTYPFRLFVTFIHEGGHAVAAVLTGNRVFGLRVNPNGSGLTYTTGRGLGGLFVASAGYLGAMGYGAVLLALIRRAVAARAILYGTALYVLLLTLLYGFPSIFTLVSGILLAAGLFAAARYASVGVASFLVGFLAVQCIVNALFDLRTLLFLTAPLVADRHNDAANMAQATGLPALFWALAWTVLALGMLFAALRGYAAGGRPARRHPRLEGTLEV